MVKQRIIPKFLLDGGRLVKGVRFHEDFRQAGNPVSTAKVYDSYGVDELIFLDIAASVGSRLALIEVVQRVSKEVFMPMTVGGGVRTVDDIAQLLRAGADKIAITTAALENPEFVREGARRFGDQCITVGIDYREIAPGVHRVFSHAGRQQWDTDPVDWARRMEDAQCGELLLCSIDRDGTMSGYDLDMIERVMEAVNVPIIASSGCGSLQHCLDAFATGVSALAISSMFLFTDHSPIKVRSYLRSKGVHVRANSSSRN